MRNRRFLLGHIQISPMARTFVSLDDIRAGLSRHRHGDWGELGETLKGLNEIYLRKGVGKLFSNFRDKNNIEFWICTNYERTVTRLTIPELEVYSHRQAAALQLSVEMTATTAT